MYNTVSFLFDESLPSLELISQQVMLDESNIARRLTASQAMNEKIHLQRPHSLRAHDLITEEVFSPTWTNWRDLLSSSQQTPP